MRKQERIFGLGFFLICFAVLLTGCLLARPAFAGENVQRENGGLLEEVFDETAKEADRETAAGAKLPIRTVNLGFELPVSGTKVTQTADKDAFVTTPALLLTVPNGAVYALDGEAVYVSDPNNKTPLTGTFTLDEDETCYALVRLTSVGDAYFTNAVTFDTIVENAEVKRRSVTSETSLTICIAFNPKKQTLPENYFAVQVCDTNNSAALGGSVTIEATLPNGDRWEASGKKVDGFADVWVPGGSTVRLTADADYEYNFQGWYPVNVERMSSQDPHYLTDRLLSKNPVYEFTGNPVGEKLSPKICAVFEPSAGEVERITLNKSSLSLTAGKTSTLKATVYPENAEDAEVSWKSGNKGIATVTSAGKVKGIAPGTVTITASTPNGTKATCKVTVKAPAVSKVTLNKTSASTNVGLTVQLQATAVPENAADKTLTWTSSNAKVAKVSSTGLVTAVRCGTCTITATAKSGVKADCQVTVAQKYAYELSKSGAYRFLSDTAAIKKLKKAGWTAQKAFRVAGKSTVPVYEIYNKTTKRYRYTTNKSDATAAKKAGSTVSTAFYACKTKTTPVYEILGKDQKTYYYTTSKSTVTAQKKKGWTYKGIAWYAELTTLK